MTIQEKIKDKESRIKALDKRILFFGEYSMRAKALIELKTELEQNLEELKSKLKTPRKDKSHDGIENLLINRINSKTKQRFKTIALREELKQSELFEELLKAWLILNSKQARKIKGLMNCSTKNMVKDIMNLWAKENSELF